MNFNKNILIDLINKHKNFEMAFSIQERNNNKKWYCPACKSTVKITGKKRYETSFEHIVDPNKEEYPLRDIYQCINKNCISNKNKIFWDYEGNRYNGFTSFRKECINENDAPFGSFQRKQNVEIYKRGVKDITYLHPILCLWLFQPIIEHEYLADTDGNVLKRKNHLKFLKKDENNEYTIPFTNCFTTWSFLFKRFFHHIKLYDKTKNIKFLNKVFNQIYNTSWEYKFYLWFINTFYFKYKKLITK